MNRDWIRFLPGLLQRRLDDRPTLQKIISNTTWLALDKLVHGGVGFLVMISIGRYLGPEGFGLYNYALAFAMIFAALASLGLDGIVVRNIVREPERKEEILGSAFRMKFVAGILILPVLAVVTSVFRGGDPRVRPRILIIAAGTVFHAFDVLDFWFQSQVQAKFSVFSRGLAFLAVSGFKLLLVLKAAPLAAFAWASMAEVALAAIGLALAYKLRGHRLLLWKWDAAAARGLLKDSWPLILSGLTIMIFMKIDQIMLGRMKGFINLGVYASAQKIIETWNFIPMIILSSLYPSMVKFRMAGEAGFSGFAQKIFVLLFVMNLAAILFLALFSRGLMTMLFGGRFAGAALPLLILSLGSVFNFSSALRGQIFLINNLTIYHTYSGLVGIAVLVCLNLVLIPRLGTTGVAVSNAVSAFVSGYLTSFVFRPLRFIGRMQSRAFFFRMEKNAPPV